MKVIKGIWNAITTVLVALVVILAIALVGVRLVGFQVFTVLSGSMEPTYHVGSLIYVKEIDTDDLRAGDPITYLIDEDTVVTHRIVEVVPDEEEPETIRFRTKGDAYSKMIPAEDKFKAIGAYAAKRSIKILKRKITGKSAT